MEFNKLVFPAPTPSYTPFTLSRLMWIPRSRYFSFKTLVKTMDKFEDVISDTKTSTEGDLSAKIGNSNQYLSFYHLLAQVHIPVLYHPYYEGSNYFILYFHGNAEDIGYAAEFTRRLSTGLKVNVLSVEYPGYGAYEGDPNSKTILEDAEIIFDFLTTEVGIDPEHIFVFGRSIGSGPATHLAAHRNPGMLILMSPYTSIRAVVKDMAGQWATYLVAERFKNIDEIEKVSCPSFFIHGKKDKLIPVEHTKKLFERCKSVAAMNISESMTHNDFSLSADIVRPLRKFLKQLDIKMDICPEIHFPEYIKRVPNGKIPRKKKKAITMPSSFPEKKTYTF